MLMGLDDDQAEAFVVAFAVDIVVVILGFCIHL